MNRRIRLADGGEMNVAVVAQAAPTDTVFIHGNMASNTWWEPTLQEWEKSRLSGPGHLLLIEWRGFGQSSAPKSESQLHPAALADDVIFALRELGVSRANLVAHSTGGIIALHAMAKAPALFDRAALLDPVGAKGVTFDDAVFGVYTQMRKDRELCSTVMASTINGVDTKSALFKRIADEAFGISELNSHGVLKQLRGLSSEKEVRTIQRSVLVMHGDLDPILPIADSRTLAKLLTHGEFLELKGHGHSMNVEDPAAFTKLVQNFLFGLPAMPAHPKD